MATRGNGGNNTDLSDLKARLGLTAKKKAKQEEEAESGSSQGGPQGQGPPKQAQGPPPGSAQGPPTGTRQGPPAAEQASSGAPQTAVSVEQESAPTAQQPRPSASSLAQSAASAQPQRAAESAAHQQPSGPPQAGQRPIGPPPGAKRPKPKRSRPNLEDLPVQDVDIDESVTESSMFSPQFIVVMVGMLGLGLLFGIFGTRAQQARGIYANQTRAATKVRDRVKPKVETARDLADTVAKMNPTEPDFELAAALPEEDFVPGPGVLGSGAAYIGGDNVYNITQFQSKAAAFEQMLKRHNYMTNTVDKEELKQLIEGNELLQGDKNFAVRFNYDQLLNHLKAQEPATAYKPRPGSLVLVEEFKVDEEGNVAYQTPGGESSGKESVRAIVPLDKSEILKTGGQNALQRYKRRVDVLKYYALDLQKSTSGLLAGLDTLADRGDPPLLQFSAPDPPSESSPAPAPAGGE